VLPTSAAYDDAIAQYEDAGSGTDFALAQQTRGMALAQKHDYPKAIAEFQTALTLSGGAAPYLPRICIRAGWIEGGRQANGATGELSHQRYVQPSTGQVVLAQGRQGFSSAI